MLDEERLLKPKSYQPHQISCQPTFIPLILCLLQLQGYREDAELVLESDTDEQLLMHIPFQQHVKLQAIVIKSTAKEDQAPKKVKLFINAPTIGFSGKLLLLLLYD